MPAIVYKQTILISITKQNNKTSKTSKKEERRKVKEQKRNGELYFLFLNVKHFIFPFDSIEL